MWVGGVADSQTRFKPLKKKTKANFQTLGCKFSNFFTQLLQCSHFHSLFLNQEFVLESQRGHIDFLSDGSMCKCVSRWGGRAIVKRQNVQIKEGKVEEKSQSLVALDCFWVHAVQLVWQKKQKWSCWFARSNNHLCEYKMSFSVTQIIVATLERQ